MTKTIKPEFSYQYEISYKGPMPMGFFYTNLYYRDVTNSIEWYDFDGLNNDISTNIITFKNADELRGVIKSIPLKNILIETDSPFLAPSPLRGKINEPSYVKYIAQYLADF